MPVWNYTFCQKWMSELAWQVIFGEMHAQGITLSLMLVAISATVRERSRGGEGSKKHH